VPNYVDVDTTTKAGILTQIVDEVPRLVVAVMQRDQARIYIAEQGTAEQRVQLASEIPVRTSRVGKVKNQEGQWRNQENGSAE
jgi:hypothetical protein